MKDPNWRKCILNADSKDIIKRIPDNSIDFIFTDPPYNLGKHSTGNIPLPGRSAMNNDVAEWDMIDFNPEEWADEFIRILKPTGNLFIFTSYNQLGRWYSCLDHKFDTSNFMIWHKTNPAPKIFKAGFLNSCEMIFTCWNKKHTWNFISQSEMHNFIESPICMRPERLCNPKHPTQKPVSILKKIIEIASNENDIIFDPFMGVGSTGVASLELSRRFIGVEINNTYFEAAKLRINNTMQNKQQMLKTTSTENNYNLQGKCVSEDAAVYITKDDSIETFFQSEYTPSFERQTGLNPLIKWPGGKEKELKYIIPNLPQNFNSYYEPFVGGGSVFMGINAKNYYINDYSTELIDLYKAISSTNKEFFSLIRDIDTSWNKASIFLYKNNILFEFFNNYKTGLITKEVLKENIEGFCNDNTKAITNLLADNLKLQANILVNEMKQNLFHKMVRMHEIETQKHELPENDIKDNIETAIKSALYMYYRHLYNDAKITKSNDTLHCALFFFIRNYAYSGMFRYSSKGDFNVPYGGIAYNSKYLDKKIKYYLSLPLLDHFAKTEIYNLDFEKFLTMVEPQSNDFVFLDPPYDTEFSTYAKNAFTKEDQKRLANYLINKCRARWMLIIKHTDFIYDLYNRYGINIRTFDKEYVVSFMNRNNKKTTHLLITNY